MKIEHTSQDSVQVFKFIGRLVASEAKVAQGEILKALDISSNIVINCSELVFIDSSGLGILVSSFKRAVKLNGDLRLAEVMPKVAMMLELTRADKVFKIYPAVTDAISSFETHHPQQEGI
jgi:anti-sigma B factor antagonist